MENYPSLFGDEYEPRRKRQKKNGFEEYDKFVDKFKPKKTTDDCYTPPEVYETVKQWVNDNITPLEGRRIVRPFKPGGDYEREEYCPGDVVLDNPPFSILSKIIKFYVSEGIDFFLFAPSLTLFSSPCEGVSYIVADGHVIYENGADVNTSFVTNMEREHRIIVAGDLCKQIEQTSETIRGKEKIKTTKRVYPNEVVTSALLNKIATRGVCFKVPMDECHFTRKLDRQTGALFGAGYLISPRAAAERAAAERAAAERAAAERAAAERVELSAREREIVAKLGKK